MVTMRVLSTIAISTWRDVTESHGVDSAANQLAADPQLANTRVNSQSTSWQVVLISGSRDYQLIKASPAETSSRSSLEGIWAATKISMIFKPGGEALAPGGSDSTTRVSSSSDNDRYRGTQSKTVTSNVRVG